MKRVLFFTQPKWAFGTIHHALSKELYQYGVYGNLLDWTQPYTADEFKLLDDTYDFWMTQPDAVNHLHYNTGVPYEKIIAVAHAQWDMLLAGKDFGFDFYDKLAGFGVVSSVLKDKAKEFGIKRVPDVLEFGIHFDLFYRKPATQLRVLGYGGAKETKNFFGEEIKRSYLVNEALHELGNPHIKLHEHQFYNWMCMPSYYDKIDALVVSSCEEGAGLPGMEAAAAGRMVFSTPVGYFEHNRNRGGYELPVEPTALKNKLKYYLDYYFSSSKQFESNCHEFQEYAKTYDWKYKIEPWVNFIHKINK